MARGPRRPAAGGEARGDPRGSPGSRGHPRRVEARLRPGLPRVRPPPHAGAGGRDRHARAEPEDRPRVPRQGDQRPPRERAVEPRGRFREGGGPARGARSRVRRQVPAVGAKAQGRRRARHAPNARARRAQRGGGAPRRHTRRAAPPHGAAAARRRRRTRGSRRRRRRRRRRGYSRAARLRGSRDARRGSRAPDHPRGIRNGSRRGGRRRPRIGRRERRGGRIARDRRERRVVDAFEDLRRVKKRWVLEGASVRGAGAVGVQRPRADPRGEAADAAVGERDGVGPSRGQGARGGGGRRPVRGGGLQARGGGERTRGRSGGERSGGERSGGGHRSVVGDPPSDQSLGRSDRSDRGRRFTVGRFGRRRVYFYSTTTRVTRRGASLDDVRLGLVRLDAAFDASGGVWEEIGARRAAGETRGGDEGSRAAPALAREGEARG